jgi:hypothetical protein
MLNLYKCELCGREVFRDFPDPARNISIQKAPYRLPMWCPCKENPTIYVLLKGEASEESD